MAARATWTGHLKISLVSIPVKLYTAVSTASSRVKLNMLHNECLQRVKQFYQCPDHGPVERADIVKGYEYEKGKYVEVDAATLNRIRLETTKIIEITAATSASTVMTWPCPAGGPTWHWTATANGAALPGASCAAAIPVTAPEPDRTARHHVPANRFAACHQSWSATGKGAASPGST